MNESLESVLEHGGSDKICRYIKQMGIERGEIPINLVSFRRILSELHDVSADFIEERIFRGLYLKLIMFPQRV